MIEDFILLEKITSDFRTRLEEEQKKPHIEYQEQRLWNDFIKTYCQLVRTLAALKAKKNG
jgi:hypothetical protein